MVKSATTDNLARQLRDIFTRLHSHYGDLHWWPATTPFEVVIGAILTQNTAWRNVELAIANLRAADALTPAGLLKLTPAQLEALIRPAGFFRQKCARLRILAAYLCKHHGGQIEPLLRGALEPVRSRLLEFKGIGFETADAILLYAGERASFVIDAYTRRIFSRLGLITGSESYSALRNLCMTHLDSNARLYNNFHALIVEHAKQFCRKRMPDCGSCPLRPACLRIGVD